MLSPEDCVPGGLLHFLQQSRIVNLLPAIRAWINWKDYSFTCRDIQVSPASHIHSLCTARAELCDHRIPLATASPREERDMLEPWASARGRVCKCGTSTCWQCRTISLRTRRINPQAGESRGTK
jgi:hypothetical protein